MHFSWSYKHFKLIWTGLTMVCTLSIHFQLIFAFIFAKAKFLFPDFLISDSFTETISYLGDCWFTDVDDLYAIVQVTVWQLLFLDLSRNIDCWWLVVGDKKRKLKLSKFFGVAYVGWTAILSILLQQKKLLKNEWNAEILKWIQQWKQYNN